jgi:hypothetical protein
MLHTYVGNNLCMLSRTWIWEQELKCFNEKDHGHVGGFGNNETIMITYVDLLGNETYMHHKKKDHDIYG